MQDIKISNDLFWPIFDETKTAFIISGKVDIKEGSLAVESIDSGWGVIVDVVKVVHKNIADLTEEESRINYCPLSNTENDITVVVFNYTDPFLPPQYVLDAGIDAHLEEWPVDEWN